VLLLREFEDEVPIILAWNFGRMQEKNVVWGKSNTSV
jgi:hypothetical protein